MVPTVAIVDDGRPKNGTKIPASRASWSIITATERPRASPRKAARRPPSFGTISFPEPDRSLASIAPTRGLLSGLAIASSG